MNQADYNAQKRKATETEKAPRLRPAFSVATWPGYDGRRMVFHGLTDAQVASLKKTALTLGIPEQQ